MEFNHGVYTTMITPYTSDGKVDYHTAEQYVRWYIEHGCDGIFAICQSSEIFYLSLEEKMKLNSVVYKTVRSIEKETGKKLSIVSSGHTTDNADEQAYELNKIVETGTDALILITNRLDIQNEGDDVWIQNAEKLLRELPQDVKLGLYECPYPYKRLVTPKILKWCLETGRFYLMKDTCCDIEIIKERLELLKGSELKLFNANCQTLLESLRSGAAGYCGIMANYHPELYAWLYKNYRSDSDEVRYVQAFLCLAGFTETGLPYPLTAKYHMTLEGIDTFNFARNRKNEDMNLYAKDCVEQMRFMSKKIYGDLMKNRK